MRFSALSLGLVSTMSMAVYVCADLNNGRKTASFRDDGSDGSDFSGLLRERDAVGEIAGDDIFADCLDGDLFACLSLNSDTVPAAPVKRSVRLSRRKLFQRRVETGAVTDTVAPNTDVDTGDVDTGDVDTGDVDTGDVVPDEDNENENENEYDEEEEDEDDNGKRRKRDVVDDEDEDEDTPVGRR